MFTSNINNVLKKAKNYYPQVFSEECEYIKKEKKAIRYITDDLKSSDDDSDVSHEEWIKIKHHHGVFIKKDKFVCKKIKAKKYVSFIHQTGGREYLRCIV